MTEVFLGVIACMLCLMVLMTTINGAFTAWATWIQIRLREEQEQNERTLMMALHPKLAHSHAHKKKEDVANTDGEVKTPTLSDGQYL